MPRRRKGGPAEAGRSQRRVVLRGKELRPRGCLVGVCDDARRECADLLQDVVRCQRYRIDRVNQAQAVHRR